MKKYYGLIAADIDQDTKTAELRIKRYGNTGSQFTSRTVEDCISWAVSSLSKQGIKVTNLDII